MTDYIEQGVAVRSARVAKRMTQTHLAAAADVSEKTIRRAEAGERLGAESLRSICAVLGLDATVLRTEAECVPDAASEAVRLLAERERRAAFLVAMLTLSIVLTTACMILEWAEMARLARHFLTLLLILIPIAVFSRFMSNWHHGIPTTLWAEVRGMWDAIMHPVSFARRASGGTGGILPALRVACLPPCVLAAMYGFKAMFNDPDRLVALGAATIALVTWCIVKSVVRDASGVRGEDILGVRT